MKPLYSQTISHYHVKTVSLYYGKLLSCYRCKLLSLESSIYHTILIGIVGLSRSKVVYRKSGEVVKR